MQTNLIHTLSFHFPWSSISYIIDHELEVGLILLYIIKKTTSIENKPLKWLQQHTSQHKSLKITTSSSYHTVEILISSMNLATKMIMITKMLQKFFSSKTKPTFEHLSNWICFTYPNASHSFIIIKANNDYNIVSLICITKSLSSFTKQFS